MLEQDREPSPPREAATRPSSPSADAPVPQRPHASLPLDAQGRPWCHSIDADLVAVLLKRGLVPPASVARARQSKPEPLVSCLPVTAALVHAGDIAAPAVVRMLIEGRGIVDYAVAAGIPYAPRLLRRLPRELAWRLELLPTVSAAPGGPVVALAPRPVSVEDQDRVSLYLQESVAVLEHPEAEVRRAIEEAYDWSAEHGFHGVRLGEILVRDGIVPAAEVEAARADAREQRRHLGEVLLARLAIDEATLYRILAAQRGVALVRASEVIAAMDPALVRRLPLAFLRHNAVVPYRYDGAVVRAATTDVMLPPEALADRLSAEIRFELITPSDLDRVFAALSTTRDEETRLRERALDIAEPAILDDGGRQYEALADRLLSIAIRERASDLHLEVYDREVFVRLRLDGVMRDWPEVSLTKADLRGVVNVIKVRSGIDIAEHRLPLPGRMQRRTADGAVFDFRVQTQPTINGEHVVVRLLSQTAPLLSLADLGFAPDVTSVLERFSASAGGLIVIAGPTGSGKTTTLYALLDRLRVSSELKIVTAEDPIEYVLPRVQQSQVHPEIGYTFANAARAFLREDPDVILIGETRDLETAIETVRASQTGHLVLTTLHATDAVNSIRRLLDIGLDPASVSSELLGVLAQRLVRRVCDGCRTEYVPPARHVAELWPGGPPSGLAFTHGVGCERCRRTGFRGRVALGELFRTDDAVRDAIARQASPLALRELARKLGFRSMVDDACDKVAAGHTTVEEAVGALPFAAVASRGAPIAAAG